jgi:hypothetical protein
MKEYISISSKIKDATKSLKKIGYVVISDDDKTFAILAERKKIICNSSSEFLNIASELERASI